MIAIIFWSSFALLIYIYFGYPLTIFLISKLFSKPLPKNSYFPTISIVIAAHNEENVIGKTIENKLELNYPQDKLSIYVISDASSDNTDTIVKQYQPKGVTLLRQEIRGGKTAALNYAASLNKSEIIVFSDANSHYHKDALIHLAENFSVPNVGYVTGKMVYVNPQGNLIGDGCTKYMQYENFIRYHETNSGSVVGVDGGIDAIRSALYIQMPADAQPDLLLSLKVAEQGFRVVYEPKAVLNEQVLSVTRDEYRMRKRVALRALHVLYMMKHLLNPFKYGLLSFQLIFHKILRYISCVFMAIVLVLNLFLLNAHPLYSMILLVQAVFYSLAFIGYCTNASKNIPLLYSPFYFVLVHLASLVAFIQFILGKKQIIWEPRTG